MPTATFRIARTSLAYLVVPLALLGVEPTPTHAQTATQSTTADTSQCDLIDADRPGIADGSHVIGAGKIQLETAYQRERHVDDDMRQRLAFVPTLLRIGVGQRAEVRFESNSYFHERLTVDDGPSTTHSGFNPLFIGAKVVLHDPQQVGPLQVAAIVRVAPPSGTDEFRTDRTTGDIRVVADWQFAPYFSLNPNVGYGSMQSSEGARFGTALGALTLNWLPTRRLNPFIDVGYMSREDAGGTWSMIGDAGVAYIIGCDVQLDLSAGQNLHGVTAPKPFVAAGISVRADPFHRSTHPLDHLHGDRPAQPARH